MNYIFNNLIDEIARSQQSFIKTPSSGNYYIDRTNDDTIKLIVNVVGHTPKKVEVEVEKIVEKIIEKPVIQEKIIEKEIEVPKQIEKKVFVHVPFPTDDPEVIKKGPMIYNDKDKKK